MNEKTITLTGKQWDIVLYALSLLMEHDDKRSKEIRMELGAVTDGSLEGPLNICANVYDNRFVNCVRIQNIIKFR